MTCINCGHKQKDGIFCARCAGRLIGDLKDPKPKPGR